RCGLEIALFSRPFSANQRKRRVAQEDPRRRRLGVRIEESPNPLSTASPDDPVSHACWYIRASLCGPLRPDYFRFFLHRARTARRAISRRSSGGTPSQRALPPLGPPFLPPLRPRATAWGFFLRAIVRSILAARSLSLLTS